MRLVPLLTTLYGVIVSGLATSVFLALALPFALIPRGRRERWCWWTNAGAAWCVVRLALLARFDVTGREHIPFGQPYLVVANHRSWVDVLTLIWAARAEGLSKREVLYTPIMGLLGYLGGAVFFNRADPSERKRAKEECLFLLRSGVPLHVYPEGTRTRDGRLGEKIHTPLLEACWEVGVPLVPVALTGTERVIQPTFRGVIPFQTIHARFSPPVQPADHPDAHSFALAAWAQVQRGVAELEQEHGPWAGS